MQQTQNTMSQEEMEKFSLKLQNWSTTLSDNERALLKFMLELGWGRQSDPSELRRVAPFKPFVVQQQVPKLDAEFFKVMCW